jgi:23S rRNA (cytidine1920-2'-O)/16S rRNA (cytidine1409-2'-O)-methyltransferase
MSRKRLDQYLVENGMAPSRSRAQALIMAGKVKINGKVADKAGHALPKDAEVSLDTPDHPYVSRGGVKMAGALDHFHLDPSGLSCLDVGASTGGFTDCLLRRGAEKVCAVDVGYGQLHWSLRQDSRVTVVERVNVRYLREDVAPGPFDLIVADVSFISLRLIVPRLATRLAPSGKLLVLVKPQFEAGRNQVGRGGVVKDAKVREQTVRQVGAHMTEQGLKVIGSCPSPITGPAGNQEYFILAAPASTS